MDVSIIIVNYNTTSLVLDCIKSIYRHTKGIEFEIIVVDNNSDYELELHLEDIILGKTNVKILKLNENIGFGCGNNEGIKISEGRNILFLNPDTILLNNAVKIMSEYLDGNSDVGACGGNLYDVCLNPTYSFKRFFPGIFWTVNELFNTIPERLIYGKQRCFNNGKTPVKVGYVVGADLMVKSSVLNECGVFSKVFFMYYEETDLCSRIHSCGYEIHAIPSPVIIHLEGQSISKKSINLFKIDNLEKGFVRYCDIHLCHTHKYFTFLFYRLFLLSRVWLIKDDTKKEIYINRLRFHDNHKLETTEEDFV